jgi:hypothetical protein
VALKEAKEASDRSEGVPGPGPAVSSEQIESLHSRLALPFFSSRRYALDVMARPPSAKIRLDRLLLERGLVDSREKGQALVLAGQVLVNNQKVEKCGALVNPEALLRLLGESPRYVSRGGLKLAGALEHFRIDLEGKTCLDIGASTGGFTDCLLRNGVARVYAIDVGYGQLDYRLRQGRQRRTRGGCGPPVVQALRPRTPCQSHRRD